NSPKKNPKLAKIDQEQKCYKNDQTNKQLASIIRHAVEFSKNDQTLTSAQQAPRISKNCASWLMSTRLLGGKSRTGGSRLSRTWLRATLSA
ncbi:hypothetical protein, partial [Flexivirga lutea]